MPSLAKLTRPRLARIHPRERLFLRFDQCRREAAIWISGPPGAGKTTLAASYLESRTLPALWYQLDGGDADPASFFYYLAQGAREAGFDKTSELPLLTPEYLPDLAGFTRRYFRRLFAALPEGAVLVLDNYQELPASAPLQALIAGAVKEVPAALNLVLVSRSEPPMDFAGLAANGALAHIGADELALTLDETARVAALEGGFEESTVQALHTRTEGWAAGVVLMTKRYRRLGAEGPGLTSHDALADYFDSEILARADAPTRELLLATAWLPQFTADMASRLTGDIAAARRLAALHRQHCFTSLSEGAAPAYQYHALFRDFLLGRATTMLSGARLRRLQHRAAELLAAEAQEDAAFRLYCEAGDPGAAVHLLLARAPELIGQGRWQMLQAWLAALPKEMVEATPWLIYWQGVCTAHAGPSAARSPLRQAYEGFLKGGDALGQGLAAAATVETYFLELSTFRPVDEWIPVLERFLAARPSFPCLELELRVLTSTGLALFYRQPQHPLLDKCMGRIHELLASELQPDHKVAAGTFLLNYLTGNGELEEMQTIAKTVGQLIDHPGVRPLSRLWWWTFVALVRLRSGSLEETLADLERGLAVAEEYGFHFAVPFLPLCKAHANLVFGQPAKAEALMRKAKPLVWGVRDRFFLDYLECLYAVSSDGTELAVERARRMVEANREVGMGHLVEAGLSLYALTLANHGEHEAAQRASEEALPMRAETPFARHDRNLLIAYCTLLRGDRDEARALLADTFATGSARRYLISMHWPLGMMPALCAFALEEGIEPQHTRQLIRTLNLKPPSPEVENWPWPVKLYTLGRVSVVIDGEALAFQGKAQKKPLELLKAILAHRGRGVDQGALAQELWPDLDGAAATNAIAIALHRLRKLLGRDDVLILRDGQLSLDARQAWVDAWAFERLCGKVEQGRASADELPALAQRINRLYLGHFLSGEEAPWAIAARERLRSKFLRAVTTLGRALEGAAHWDDLSALYRRAIALDPLAEEFHCGLMASLRAQGRLAEALDAYRHCRDILSITLGVEPSPATQALYRSLKQL
jgi:ATP/maltotriose-dependent transcriptional regulator MalT/DNA-binding SARP family transcriptional activator